MVLLLKYETGKIFLWIRQYDWSVCWDIRKTSIICQKNKLHLIRNYVLNWKLRLKEAEKLNWGFGR